MNSTMRFIWRCRYTTIGVLRRMGFRTAWYCSGCAEDWQKRSPREAVLYEIELGWADAG